MKVRTIGKEISIHETTYDHVFGEGSFNADLLAAESKGKCLLRIRRIKECDRAYVVTCMSPKGTVSIGWYELRKPIRSSRQADKFLDKVYPKLRDKLLR